jgi:hypothetical protein
VPRKLAASCFEKRVKVTLQALFCRGLMDGGVDTDGSAVIDSKSIGNRTTKSRVPKKDFILDKCLNCSTSWVKFDILSTERNRRDLSELYMPH